jgi:hypothetical protein
LERCNRTACVRRAQVDVQAMLESGKRRGIITAWTD